MEIIFIALGPWEILLVRFFHAPPNGLAGFFKKPFQEKVGFPVGNRNHQCSGVLHQGRESGSR